MGAKRPLRWDTAEVSKVPKKVPHLIVKGSRFYFRMRVPLPLVESTGKTEITEALGDLTKPQAEVRARELASQYAAHFLAEKHRLGLVDSPPAPPRQASIPQREVTLEELHALAKASARALLFDDEEVRVHGTRTDWGEYWLGAVRDLDLDVAAALADHTMGPLKARVRAELAKQSLKLPEDRHELRRMLRVWATEHGLALEGIVARGHGKPFETPAAVALPDSLDVSKRAPSGPAEKTAGELKLRDVLELWKTDERTRPAKTIQKAELAVAQFEERTGNPSLGVLNKAMGSEYRRALLGLDMSDKTASDRLSWVQILLNFEVGRYGRIAVNPWKGLAIKVKRSKARDEWSDEDAQKLFALPVFQRYELPVDKNAGGAAAYWVPIIGAFTGARITEIAQLLVDDIRQEAGQWLIRFAVAETWQSLKRDASHRTIPMHPELVRLGLPDYVQALMQRGESRLFPDAKVSRLNNAGGGLSKWFSSLKTAAGFGPEHTFHSWRNTVETKLQRAREGQLHIDCYLGHKPKGSEGVEYARLKPVDLIATAKKVTYPGLKLPRVWDHQGRGKMTA